LFEEEEKKVSKKKNQNKRKSLPLPITKKTIFNELDEQDVVETRCLKDGSEKLLKKKTDWKRISQDLILLEFQRQQKYNEELNNGIRDSGYYSNNTFHSEGFWLNSKFEEESERDLEDKSIKSECEEYLEISSVYSQRSFFKDVSYYQQYENLTVEEILGLKSQQKTPNDENLEYKGKQTEENLEYKITPTDKTLKLIETESNYHEEDFEDDEALRYLEFDKFHFPSETVKFENLCSTLSKVWEQRLENIARG
ncbi:hypothetical protein HK099_002764, partial [Clydaea vesicula]